MKKKRELKKEIEELSQTSEDEKSNELAASIEILQNNGVFRNAVLNQLIQINRNLANLTGKELPKEETEEEEDEDDEEEE